LNLHLMESLKNVTKEFMTGGQIIRDLSRPLNHDAIYI
jgi:hypothetical protein